jgi:large subunit ribosomal protein L30
MTFAVVRVRSSVHVKEDIADTMDLLNLNRANHCVLVHDSPQNRGMLNKIKDFVTWGEVDAATLATVLKERGMLTGRRPLTDVHVKANSKFKDVAELAQQIAAGKAKLKDVKEAKVVLRLHPPIKGYEGIKRSYVNGGALGYRGKDINALLLRMLKVVD